MKSAELILQIVKEKFPDLESLPAAKLRLVEKAIGFASEIGERHDLISKDEHNEFISNLGTRKWHTGFSLRAYRLRQDLTQEELAKKSQISQANISAMESGKRPIGLQSAKKLAKALRCRHQNLL